MKGGPLSGLDAQQYGLRPAAIAMRLTSSWTGPARDHGRAESGHVQPGRSFTGFRAETRSRIVLETGQQGRFDFTLSPVEVTDSINQER
jgi:hypothetical protein